MNIKNILTIILKIVILLPSIILLFVILILKLRIDIRIGPLISSRIGHLAANSELYLCEKLARINKNNKRTFDIFYTPAPISNLHLVRMLRRRLFIIPGIFCELVQNLNSLIPNSEDLKIPLTIQEDRDIFNLLDKYRPQLSFTNKEELKGQKILDQMGIPADAKYICLMVRDQKYLQDYLGSRDYSYHDYRNSSVDNYIAAAEQLANKGYYIIRMGSIVEKALKISHPRIIDYATNGMRSDFMDIYLGANCFFCISNPTGLDAVPYIFRRPIVYVNCAPISYVFTFRKNDLFIPKKYRFINSDKFMSFSQIFNGKYDKFLRTNDYINNGIELIENSSEEILEVCLEMESRLTGSWQPISHYDDTRQKAFWDKFPIDSVDDFLGRPLHGEINIRIGTAFLKNYFDLQLI